MQLDSHDPLAADISAINRIDAVSKILEVACRTTGMGFAVIARVTGERWVACAVRDELEFGLVPGDELPFETTFCSKVRRHNTPVIIDDVATDQQYCDSPVPKMYGFNSYISIPIVRSDGSFFGTLCALDKEPAQVNNPRIINMFNLFAELIALHLQDQEHLAATETALADEQHVAELREQFIAVLGHDLRNPLSSISAAAEVLRMTAPAGQNAIVEGVQKSVLRMSGLINDIMDFARTRLGPGLALDCRPEADIGAALQQVVTELQTAWQERRIDTDIHLDRPVFCDRAKLAQLLSNLVANALTHGDSDAPVEVVGKIRGDEFILSVSNRGVPIPPEAHARLFQPFSRVDKPADQKGLGLGLYIASQIARAHGGSLAVHSNDEATCFTLRMPCGDDLKPEVRH